MPHFKQYVSYGTWLLAFVLYCFVYGWRLSFPTTMYHDELYVVGSAHQILDLVCFNNSNTHPPLQMLWIALNILILGDHSWVWRLGSFACGFGSIVLLFHITHILTSNRLIAFFASFFFALDGLTVIFSRIAMLESTMLMFMLLSVYLLALTLRHGYQTRLLLCASISLGLALATRWIALVGFVPLILILIHQSKHLNIAERLKRRRDQFIAFGLCVAVYLSLFLVYPLFYGYDWTYVFSLQKILFTQLSSVYERTASALWTWPLQLNPKTFFYSEKMTFSSSFGLRRDNIIAIIALGNPVIVWGGCLALFALLLKFIKTKTWHYGFIVICFIACWTLPWIFVTRQKYSYYLYPSMPFLCMALGIMLNSMLKLNLLTKILSFIFLALVLVSFTYWYPLWVGLPLKEALYQNYFWFLDAKSHALKVFPHF